MVPKMWHRHPSTQSRDRGKVSPRVPQAHGIVPTMTGGFSVPTAPEGSPALGLCTPQGRGGPSVPQAITVELVWGPRVPQPSRQLCCSGAACLAADNEWPGLPSCPHPAYLQGHAAAGCV